MPSTPPSSRKALLAPDATPSRAVGTAPSTSEARGTKKRVMPMPQMMKGSTRSA